MLGGALSVRSQQPQGIDQKIWGALHILQHEMIWTVRMATGKLPARLIRLRTQMQFAVVEKRRGVKARPARYSVRFLKKDLN